MDYPDIFPPQSVFDFLRTQKPLTYKIETFDLSTVRSLVPNVFQGNFFQILEITKGASLSVRFNEDIRSEVTFTDVQHKFGLYHQVYLTNTAQAGSTCKIFFGLNEFYIPFFKSDITSDLIIKPNINLVQSLTQTVTNVATALVLPATSRPVKIHFYNNTSKVIYIGGSTLNAGANGFPIFPAQLYPLDLSPHWLNTDLYVQVASGSYDLNYFVFATEI